MVAAPISLYLDLERGQKADLEVVASASLAFAAAVREIAFILDPSIEVRIELASGTEGSLSLNSLLKIVRGKLKDPMVLGSIIATVSVYFGHEIRDYVVHKILDSVYEEVSPDTKPSETDVKAVAKQATEIAKKGVGERHVKQVYKAIERDQSIKGIGTTTESGRKPDTLVPRSQFATRAGYEAPVEITIRRRQRLSDEALTIVKPVLEHNKRKWRFRGLEGEFGAEIDDDAFLNDTLSGRHPIPMIEGVQLKVELVTVEEFQDNIWKPIDHRITKVYGYQYPPAQTSMRFFSNEDSNNDDDD